MTGQTRRRRGGTPGTIAPSESADTASVTGTVARRAYELFLERGAVHGHDLDDWLTAERQIRGTSAPGRRPSKRSTPAS